MRDAVIGRRWLLLLVLLVTGAVMVRHGRLASPTLAAAPDTDGDGIPDSAERGAAYTSAGGRVDRKDIWVECDYMRGQRPQARVERQAVKAFARAPLQNPDGTRGVTLHVSVDDEVPYARTWGDATQPDGFREMRARLLATRDQYMDGDPAYVHYCAFVNQISPSGISGISLDSTGGLGIPGDMFIVALGGPWGAQGRELGMRTGTFLHELGHNLGLRHGGADHVNYKPNYISVMNYLYQEGFAEVGPAGPRRALHWDYSRYRAPNLNERALSEPAGVPAAKWFAERFIAFRFCEFSFQSFYYRLNHPVDWNCDGDHADTDFSHDVNRDFEQRVLVSQDNWERLVWDGGLVGGAGASRGSEYLDPRSELDAGLAGWLRAALRSAGAEGSDR